jgi:type III pantothenate kinase
MGALESKTAQLPSVEIVKPSEILGRSTVESIQSGLYHGTLATVRSLAACVTEEHFARERPVILGTGGFGRLFEDEQLFDAFVRARADRVAAGGRLSRWGRTSAVQ